MSIAPGEGERRAQRGLIPQYKVAAEKVYTALIHGELREVGLADPEAETLDDVQIIRRRGASLVLDAYQVKWSGPGAVLNPGDFSGLIAELLKAREAVIASQANRAEAGGPAVSRVIAHLYTSRTPSTFSRKGDAFDGGGRTLHGFIEGVWWPAERELVRTIGDVDAKWHAYLTTLAGRCSCTVDELLRLAVDVRVEVGRQLEEDTIDPQDWKARDRLKDLVDLRTALGDLVTDPHKTHVWVSTRELIDKLGSDWKERWHPRSEHEFPLTQPYEQVEATATELRGAFDRFDQGYVVLTGSPGSGKSTLLTRLLRGDRRVAARYYAYVPDNESQWRGEAEHFLHDLYLALATRQGHHGFAPRRGDLSALRDAFRDEIRSLGEQARRDGSIEMVVIDGLDHVTRDPQPHRPLLNELPVDAEIPEGVIFVLGTRGLNDLPNHARKAVVGDRHVEMGALSRAAVIRLAESEGLDEIAETVADLSAGHPLMARTYLAMAKDIEPSEREAALAARAPASGEVWDFYDGVWESVSELAEVVELLGTLCRIRGTIRLPWLLQTGSSPAEVERLKALRYLFNRSGPERWTFFHSSFREFLRQKTAALDGAYSVDTHRTYHARLAQRCGQSDEQSPERFDRLFHLIESGQPQIVLREATPAFFREQADGVRPRIDIQGDIQSAAGALAECHDPIGALNVALAAFELQIRGYQYPETVDFLILLARIGQPELAVAHLGEIDNGTVGHDRRTAAMKLARTLHGQGLEAEAERVFELHEPLEWLGGSSSSWLRRAPGGDRPSLWAWAKAAARLRGPQYVTQTVRRVRPPEDLHQHERLTEEELCDLRVDLLWTAGHEFLARERWEDAAVIRAELEAIGYASAEALALLDLREIGFRHGAGVGDLSGLDGLAVDLLPDHARIELAWLYRRARRLDVARAIFEETQPAALPDDRHFDRRDRRDWELYYAYWRLAGAVGVLVDPVQAVPDSEKGFRRQTVLAGRHLVAFAQLEGRGEATVVEIEAALARLHAYWATSAGRDDLRRPAEVRAVVTRRAIAAASELGGEATTRLFDYFTRRWAENSATRRIDSAEIITAFATAGVGAVSIREALLALEALTEESDSPPDDWVELGLAWVRLGDKQSAARCADRAVSRTLSLSSEKDLQLATWVKLIDPLLHGPDGRSACDKFVGALVELERVSYGGSPDYAARILVERLGKHDPGRAWRAGQRFLEAGLLGADDVLVALLAASAHCPSTTWWIALCELIAVYGVDVPTQPLRDAVAADVALAREWLPQLVERVAIEGRPTCRRSWRAEISEIARRYSIDEVEIEPAELEVSEEAPVRERHVESSDGSEPPEALSVEDALMRLEDPDANDRHEALRALRRRIGELNDSQLRRLLAGARDREEEPAVLAALSSRSMSQGLINEAWEQGLCAIRTSRPGDWSRPWAGGPVLKLIPELQAIDRERLRPEVYAQFAELAQSVSYFLGAVGGDLDDYVQALELPPEETASAAWEMARAVLREVAELPPANEFEPCLDASEPDAAEFDAAIESAVGWLLGSRYILAWEAAQRAALTMLRRGLGADLTERCLASDDAERVLRACAVIEAAGQSGEDISGFGEALAALGDAERLSCRAAGASCLQAMGQRPPGLPEEKELPARLRLELPAHPGARQIASGLRAHLLAFREEVDQLAASAGVDEDALYAYVVERAEALAGRDLDDSAPGRRGGIFGFGFVRPSAVAARAALDETAAVLVDARYLSPGTALTDAGLTPLYDTALLTSRPSRRPAEIAPFVGLDDRGFDLYRRPVAEMAQGAADRLLKELDGWHVLGEWTELTLLDRSRHYERRVSAVTYGLEAPIEDFGQLVIAPVAASSYRRLRRGAPSNGRTVMRPSLTVMASPDSWLALHPEVAALLGLAPDRSSALDWRLDDELAVRSLWWRSGYDRWNPYSENDEVGHGWLVLASAEVVEGLREQGRLLRACNVWTGRHGDGDTQQQEERMETVAEI